MKLNCVFQQFKAILRIKDSLTGDNGPTNKNKYAVIKK